MNSVAGVAITVWLSPAYPQKIKQHAVLGYMLAAIRDGMVWYGMVEVCEGAPVAVGGWGPHRYARPSAMCS